MASKKLRPSPDLLFQLESTFRANGYRALTMEKLAESCNFSRRALYFYFGSKAEAFRAVMARGVNQRLPPVAPEDLIAHYP